MTCFVLLLYLFFALPDDRLEALARSGNIQENAPVKATVDLLIKASPERVWALLSDIKNWPKWQHDITQADISGPLQVGAAFTWTSGMQIQSRIALLRPSEELVWTGTAYGARAIHVWKFQRTAEGKTRVKTIESMDGFLLKLFYSSEKLENSDRRWLSDLKAAAEK